VHARASGLSSLAWGELALTRRRLVLRIVATPVLTVRTQTGHLLPGVELGRDIRLLREFCGALLNGLLRKVDVVAEVLTLR